MKFMKLMASPQGRIARFLLGAALFLVGVRISGIGGYVLAVVALVPIFAAALDVCVFAPLFGQPLNGKQIRQS